MNKTGTQRIETERLILRRFRLEDAEDMYANWASDPEVTRFLTWPAHSSVDVTKALLEDWVPRYEDGGYFNCAMEYKNTASFIDVLNEFVVDIPKLITNAAPIIIEGKEIVKKESERIISFLFLFLL